MKTCILALALCLLLVAPLALAASIPDGAYPGTTKGYGGELTVNVTFKGGRIASVEVTGESETPEYGGRAVADLPAIIAENNSLGVDAVTGATISSRAIFRAVADAIRKAGGDPKAYGYTSDEEIQSQDVVTITGLPDGAAASYTGAQLMAMEPVTVSATSVNASGKSTDMTATGVKLDAVLRSLGTAQADYEAIVLTATDGYSIEVPKSVLAQRDIIIAWDVDGQPQSPRTIVPEERAMYWVKFLGSVELKAAVEDVQTDVLYTMESAIATLKDQAEDYKYYDSMDKAVPVSALFDALSMPKSQDVELSSTDEWGKRDKYDTVCDQYLKYTGADAPLFIGPQLPEGMRLKETVLMKAGNAAILSCAMAGKKLGVLPDGLFLDKVFQLAGMKQAKAYRFTGAVDGLFPELVIDAADIAAGYLYLEQDGSVTACFPAQGKNAAVTGLSAIQAVE